MTDVLIVLLAFGLAMDAFAVSMTNGMCYRISPFKNALSSGVAFGLAQGLMPFIGYQLGRSFSQVVERVDHWMALLLLGFIGGRMVWDAFQERLHPEQVGARRFSFQTLALQAVATSIDALAVGVSLGALQVDLLSTVCTIAVITFGCSFLGVLLGNSCGRLLKDKAEFVGGVILIVIGIKIFLEHSSLL